MGQRTGHICTVCGTKFSVDSGGGFMFDMLHCEQCGRTPARSVSWSEPPELPRVRDWR